MSRLDRFGALFGTRAFWLVSSAAVVLVILASMGWLDDRGADDDRAAAIEVASDQVLDLTTLDSASVNAKLEAMGSRVTGDFKEQFDGFSKTFASVIKEQKVSATGEIKSAAIAKYSSGSAEVLIASSAKVSSSKEATPASRDYRMRVTLDKVDGVWLVSGMEFVR